MIAVLHWRLCSTVALCAGGFLQGDERDIIIFSCVRADEFGEIGFLKEGNRLNVALTRAKEFLFVFGNAERLLADNSADKFVKGLVTNARERRVLKTVPKQLAQRDDEIFRYNGDSVKDAQVRHRPTTAMKPTAVLARPAAGGGVRNTGPAPAAAGAGAASSRSTARSGCSDADGFLD